MELLHRNGIKERVAVIRCAGDRVSGDGNVACGRLSNVGYNEPLDRKVRALCDGDIRYQEGGSLSRRGVPHGGVKYYPSAANGDSDEQEGLDVS